MGRCEQIKFPNVYKLTFTKPWGLSLGHAQFSVTVLFNTLSILRKEETYFPLIIQAEVLNYIYLNYFIE